MREVRHRFAGLLPAPSRVKFKSLFPSAPAPAAAPVATPPPTMPDPMSPAALAAKQKTLADSNQAGRSSTVLTSTAARAGGTLAGSFSGGKLGA